MCAAVSKASAPVPCLRANAEVASEGALHALEALLRLSVDILDDDARALANVRCCLDVVSDRLRELHDALKLRALAAHEGSFSVLAAHAERREHADLRVLRELLRALARTDEPGAVGRELAICVLRLLSNLSEDEGSYRALESAHDERSAA